MKSSSSTAGGAFIVEGLKIRTLISYKIIWLFSTQCKKAKVLAKKINVPLARPNKIIVVATINNRTVPVPLRLCDVLSPSTKVDILALSAGRLIGYISNWVPVTKIFAIIHFSG